MSNCKSHTYKGGANLNRDTVMYTKACEQCVDFKSHSFDFLKLIFSKYSNCTLFLQDHRT